ncbi:hypothetical protein GLOIN_2v1569603 [Rhizophagus irregularis DAOM 181602=DAOM 197198]|uniref:Uncharacterized protein n=1 Tax=Rhizophagus irregularis (strain DAOM 181602 / DAOM 197198 / MUCL 43194) TaxID=747089 RepID=A0A2P4QBH3_RHIID|nr:hypothetical protein GLOIN_2v1569603 [Rhizophagus irregularis DAOM 181602=DAOM 197198]POG74990.1 hypothetical protein GLOIN_2v1569603 [Rhizophagus irregularis DAOM 181602=DAOM 197198]|eukprot:XP_025181856.1 hypothetical protein GLOIN_2v1569603 [Rhizophagus irregularis DAOM 181602=DAOM 197198]
MLALRSLMSPFRNSFRSNPGEIDVLHKFSPTSHSLKSCLFIMMKSRPAISYSRNISKCFPSTIRHLVS